MDKENTLKDKFVEMMKKYFEECKKEEETLAILKRIKDTVFNLDNDKETNDFLFIVAESIVELEDKVEFLEKKIILLENDNKILVEQNMNLSNMIQLINTGEKKITDRFDERIKSLEGKMELIMEDYFMIKGFTIMFDSDKKEIVMEGECFDFYAHSDLKTFLKKMDNNIKDLGISQVSLDMRKLSFINSSLQSVINDWIMNIKYYVYFKLNPKDFDWKETYFETFQMTNPEFIHEWTGVESGV